MRSGALVVACLLLAARAEARDWPPPHQLAHHELDWGMAVSEALGHRVDAVLTAGGGSGLVGPTGEPFAGARTLCLRVGAWTVRRTFADDPLALRDTAPALPPDEGCLVQLRGDQALVIVGPLGQPRSLGGLLALAWAPLAVGRVAALDASLLVAHGPTGTTRLVATRLRSGWTRAAVEADLAACHAAAAAGRALRRRVDGAVTLVSADRTLRVLVDPTGACSWSEDTPTPAPARTPRWLTVDPFSPSDLPPLAPPAATDRERAWARAVVDALAPGQAAAAEVEVTRDGRLRHPVLPHLPIPRAVVVRHGGVEVRRVRLGGDELREELQPSRLPAATTLLFQVRGEEVLLVTGLRDLALAEPLAEAAWGHLDPPAALDAALAALRTVGAGWTRVAMTRWETGWVAATLDRFERFVAQTGGGRVSVARPPGEREARSSDTAVRVRADALGRSGFECRPEHVRSGVALLRAIGGHPAAR